LRYHAILTCSGLNEDEGPQAALDVQAEFEQRPWHQNVQCRWEKGLLWLDAENDYDEDGKALLDEFGDAVIASVHFEDRIVFEIKSVVSIS